MEHFFAGFEKGAANRYEEHLATKRSFGPAAKRKLRERLGNKGDALGVMDLPMARRDLGRANESLKNDFDKGLDRASAHRFHRAAMVRLRKASKFLKSTV